VRLTTRGVRVVAALVVLMAAVAGVAWFAGDDLVGTSVDPGTPVPAAAELTAEESGFYGYVAPRLREVTAQTQKLAEMGRARSRNLIELERRGQRLDDVSAQIDDFVAARGVPPRFAAAHERYAAGIAAVRRAKDESRAAFARFDWDRVARAVDVMEEGAKGLVSASEELERAAGRSDLPSPRSVG
jgi:hypothetical protein